MITLLTVSFRSGDLLKKNLEQTRSLNTKVSPQWIVVNNDGEDLSGLKGAQVIPGSSPVKTAFDEGSYHHAAGLQLGLKEVKTRYLLVMDPDFFVSRPEWLDDILEEMKRKDLAFFGAGWDPLNVSKYQGFPCVHFLLIDLEKVPLQSLDFTPQLEESAASRERVKWLKRKLVARRGLYAWVDVGAHWLGVHARDTGYQIFRRYRSYPCELLQFVLSPEKQKSLEATMAEFPPGVRSLASKLLGLPLQHTICVEESSTEGDEFYWKSQPFAVHLRRVAKKRSY